jgi:hypothetical protein
LIHKKRNRRSCKKSDARRSYDESEGIRRDAEKIKEAKARVKTEESVARERQKKPWQDEGKKIDSQRNVEKATVLQEMKKKLLKWLRK